MECQRCLTGKEAKYRVYTEAMDMKVCTTCADEARKLGIAVEVLAAKKKKITKRFAARSVHFRTRRKKATADHTSRSHCTIVRSLSQFYGGLSEAELLETCLPRCGEK
jgi:ribosome-binding protein aMBF1 (putative translation factor)